MTKNFEIRNSTAEFLTFVATGKEDGIQVLYKDELIADRVCAKFAHTAEDGKTYRCTMPYMDIPLQNSSWSGRMRRKDGE